MAWISAFCWWPFVAWAGDWESRKICAILELFAVCKFETTVLAYRTFATLSLLAFVILYYHTNPLMLCTLLTCNLFKYHAWIQSSVSVPSAAVYPRCGTKSLLLLGRRRTEGEQAKPDSSRKIAVRTRSHTEMVGDMSHVTLNFDLSKIPLVHF